MAVNLTAGAITRMLNGEVTSEKEMVPILQVSELKLIQSKLQQPHQNQELSKDRYKLSLSDGILSQQGMLNSSLNVLVKQENIQIGSILKLTHYVCNLIQNRRIVIIMELEIIAKKLNIIRNPVQTGKPNDLGQSSIVNTQSNNGFEQQHARRSESNGGRQINNSDTGRYGVANSAQPLGQIQPL